MINATTICDNISSGTRKLNDVLTCKMIYTHPSMTHNFPIKEIDKLQRICTCIDDFKNTNIQNFDTSSVSIDVDSTYINQLISVIECIEELIYNTHKDMCLIICKLFDFDPSKHQFTYVESMPTIYTFSEMIEFNAYIRLYEIIRQANSSDILEDVKEHIEKFKSMKFYKLYYNFNITEYSYILQNCRFIFPSRNLNTNLFIIIPTITDMYKSISNCANATFEHLHPSMLALIQDACNQIENICGDDELIRGFGKDENMEKFNLFIKYDKLNRDLFNAFVKLASLSKELEYIYEVVRSTNETQLLRTFWHLVSLIVYNKILYDIYSDKFSKFIGTNQLFANNCVNADEFLKLTYKHVQIRHEGFKLYFWESIQSIKETTKNKPNMYLRIPDINNHVVVISLVMGLYNEFLFSLSDTVSLTH